MTILTFSCIGNRTKNLMPIPKGSECEVILNMSCRKTVILYTLQEAQGSNKCV